MGSYDLNQLLQFIVACCVGGLFGAAWNWDIRRKGAILFKGGIVIDRRGQPGRYEAFARMTRVIATIGIGLGIGCLAFYLAIFYLHWPVAPRP